jgi:S-sulfo-L-cysteine synthase (O-acetyl-L-serine-dependent)
MNVQQPALTSSRWHNSSSQQTSVQSLPQTGDLLSQIGNTPLIDLSHFARGQGISPHVGVYAKAEWVNPSGSVKARAALWIVEEAERTGQLYPGKILIDSSSGNTGIAFALIGAVKGYEVHLVMPGNISQERKALARAYGAKLIESDPLEGSDGAILMVRELVAAHPERYFYANQYNNPANWLSHYESTGPEIWQQTQGKVTHFVAGLGTTGTFVGTGRYLKERNPNIQLVALQPEDELSVIEGLKYLPTAIMPAIYDASLVDRHLGIDAEDTWAMTRRLSRQAGLFVGLSGGAAMVGTIQVAKELDAGVVVTLFPDDGSKYISLGLYDRG